MIECPYMDAHCISDKCLERCDYKKPPLGVKPKYIHDALRKKEIAKAIIRFAEVQKAIPIAWIEEYNELAN